MNKNEKAGSIAEIVEKINGSTTVLLVDYSKINVEDISKIRREFRKEGVEYVVFKNTLFKRALDETGKYPELVNHLKGMTGYIFAGENAAVPAKIIKKYFDDKQKLVFKAAYVESDFYGPDKLATLASLPTKAEAVAGILGVITTILRDLASVVDEISKKQAA